MKSIALLLLTSILFAACTKDENDITMSYGQTQCNDKWGYAGTDDETKNRLGKFLDSAGISYSNLSFMRVNPGAVCLACTCPTGGSFTLQTTEPFVEKLIQLGFAKK